MTKANMLLGGVVFILGLVALSMVLSPDLVSDMASHGSQVTKPVTPRSLIRSESAIQNQSASKAPPETAMAEISPDFKMSGADQTVKAEDHGDWRVECAKTPDGKPVCQMFQRLMWKDKKSVALLVMGGIGLRDGQPIARMRFIVPLGTFLPTGLILAVDTDKDMRVPIQFCVSEGCVVNLDLSAEIVEKLKAGSTLKVVYLRPDRLTASLQVSLKGFPQALERIKNP